MPIADFFETWRGGRGVRGHGYWGHLISWWEQRDNPNVLLFSYEHMTADPHRPMRKLAAFCGIPLDDDLLALTLERSSLEFMLRHKDRFDDAMMRKVSEERAKLPPGSDSAKVRKGEVRRRPSELPPEVQRGHVDDLGRDGDAQGWAQLYAALEADVQRRHALERRAALANNHENGLMMCDLGASKSAS